MNNTAPRRTKTYTLAQLVDAVGIMTTLSTDTAAVVIDDTMFDGSAVLPEGKLDLPRAVTLTLGLATGAFTTDPIVFRGKRGGARVSESVSPPDANGGVTLRPRQAFDALDSVEFPQQPAAATATLGVEAICAPVDTRFCGVELAAAGLFTPEYGEPAGSQTDQFDLPANTFRAIAPTRIATANMTVGLTLYLA